MRKAHSALLKPAGVTVFDVGYIAWCQKCNYLVTHNYLSPCCTSFFLPNLLTTEQKQQFNFTQCCLPTK